MQFAFPNHSTLLTFLATAQAATIPYPALVTEKQNITTLTTLAANKAFSVSE